MTVIDGGDATTNFSTDWYTLETIRTDWRDAPPSDTALQQLLDAAQQQVLEYDAGYTWRRTPALSKDADGNTIPYPGEYTAGSIPSNLVLAQRMQTRNLWNATNVDPSSGAAGEDTYVIRPYPLDWVIRQVIRPKTGAMVVG